MTALDEIEINLRKSERDLAFDKVARLEALIENVRKIVWDDHGTPEEKLAWIKERWLSRD